MRAIVHRTYGSPDVLSQVEIDKPVPKENEVLVRVHAAAVNAHDWHVLRADPHIVRLMGMGLFTPKRPVLGRDMAGTVEAVGRRVVLFRPGDEVFGEVPSSFAEYVCATEE